ncbi:transcriptional regulator [Mycobacterium triplex]|uniref:Transcriptional regulator n=1 Tax=Mycobacterium triplex TaxID=47839 RepID=A0A024JRF0_9MYCO|nr:transcriptional regulator [Mycobacterium triplex]
MLSARERELLEVTLELLQEHGYEGLTVDAVATRARASKATIYRRWPSKAELVTAAFIESVRQVAVAPNTGTLRGDLLHLGKVMCERAPAFASTVRAVVFEVPRSPALNAAMRAQFFYPREALIRHVLRQAADRGEIEKAAIDNELLDLLPGYLLFRFIISSRPPSPRTVETLVDQVIIPSLTRPIR